MSSPTPQDGLPPRTTPTWEIEVLLSGASVFALFQLYVSLQRSLFDIFLRLSPDALALWSALGGYVQAGVLALAVGFLAHLLVRAFWAAAVGLNSIDPMGSLGRTHTLGPAQRALVAERWAALPRRIADLDDTATLVFAMSLGLVKIMAVLVLMALVAAGVALATDALSGGRIDVDGTMMVVLGTALLPSLVATLVDNHRGKKNLPPLPWTARVLRPYAALGLTADGNLGLQMMVHRLSGGRRSLKGTLAVALLVFALLLAVFAVPTLQRMGVGGVLKGDFPSLVSGQHHALRAPHYLDQLAPDEVLRVPALPSAVIRPPYARLFIPYVPHWHDAELARCRDLASSTATVAKGTPAATNGSAAVDVDWRLEPRASADTLRCLAAALPVTLDGRPVQALWVFTEDRRRDRRGFTVMIDVRNRAPGRYELQV
ncbi:MAG: hypothetical protein ACRC2H_07595, partial [Silanimonas sp.]